MSNLVTEVDRAIEFERITKQAHEANLQALRDGKIIGQSDFLKLVDIEPKLRWMNDNLKKWATGTSLSIKEINSLNQYGASEDNFNVHDIGNKPHYEHFVKIALPNLPFDFNYFYATGMFDGIGIGYIYFNTLIDKHNNNTYSVTLNSNVGMFAVGKTLRDNGHKSYSFASRGIKDYTSNIYLPVVKTDYGSIKIGKFINTKWVAFE